MKHCIDINGLALFNIRIIHSFFTIPESRYDVHICNHISEIDGIFDNVDGHTAGAFDAVGDLCFTLYSSSQCIVSNIARKAKSDM